MAKHKFSEKDATPVEQALPGSAPTSPNSPENRAAAESAAAEEVLAMRHAKERARDAVARGEKD